MEVRLASGSKRDETRHDISCLNDTGSDLLTLFYTDLMRMGPYQQYRGYNGFVDLALADGQVETLMRVRVEIRFVRPSTLLLWGDWMQEKAILRMLAPEVERLSDALMRDRLFFGTPPPATTMLPLVRPRAE